MFDWIGNDKEAEVQAIAAAVQAFFAIALICVTAYFSYKNSAVVRETGALARATERLSEIQDRQLRHSMLPLVVPQLKSAATIRSFTVQLTNGGFGPAIDLELSVIDSPLCYDVIRAPSQPLALVSGDVVEFEFDVVMEHPFTSSFADLRWREEEIEKELDSEFAGRPDRDRVKYQERNRRWGVYEQQIWDAAATVKDAGTLRATYRDINGNAMRSEVRLEAFDPPADSKWQFRWKLLRLGATTLVIPN